MLSVNYIKEEQNYYEQKIKELIEKDEYNIRRNQRQQKEITRLTNIIDEILEMVCCIEHNLDKYEEIGLDHLDYARNKKTTSIDTKRKRFLNNNRECFKNRK